MSSRLNGTLVKLNIILNQAAKVHISKKVCNT